MGQCDGVRKMLRIAAHPPMYSNKMRKLADLGEEQSERPSTHIPPPGQWSIPQAPAFQLCDSFVELNDGTTSGYSIPVLRGHTIVEHVQENGPSSPSSSPSHPSCPEGPHPCLSPTICSGIWC